MNNPLAEKIRGGKVLLGLANMYPASGIVEGMCGGWDFVWVDAQHGQMSYDSALHALQAADAIAIPTILRVPGHEPGVMCPLADLAPTAIMVPMVNTPEEARRIVHALCFAPKGSRSYGGRRVIDKFGREFYKNNPPMIIAQIETTQAVANAEAIIRTDGIDCLFFGPDDMRVQLGLPINTPVLESRELRDALEKTAKAAKAAGKSCGTVAAAAAQAKACVEMGYQVLVGGGDVVFLRTTAAKSLAELRDATAGGSPASKVDAQPGRGVY